MDKKDQTTEALRDLFNKIGWLNKDKMEEALHDYKSSEIHTLEAIEEIEDPNVTKLAAKLYMTRGALSKLTKKLIKKNLIESYQKDGNKKEVYFKLSSQGRELYDIHESLHDEFKERDAQVFEGVKEEDYDKLLAFIDKYNEHLDKIAKDYKKNI